MCGGFESGFFVRRSCCKPWGELSVCPRWNRSEPCGQPEASAALPGAGPRAPADAPQVSALACEPRGAAGLAPVCAGTGRGLLSAARSDPRQIPREGTGTSQPFAPLPPSLSRPHLLRTPEPHGTLPARSRCSGRSRVCRARFGRCRRVIVPGSGGARGAPGAVPVPGLQSRGAAARGSRCSRGGRAHLARAGPWVPARPAHTDRDRRHGPETRTGAGHGPGSDTDRTHEPGPGAPRRRAAGSALAVLCGGGRPQPAGMEP